jgi:hypothetical protein
MSIYAALVCTQCNASLWLGKVIHDDHQPIYFHIGSSDDPPHWARPELNAVLWKMLADHARHPLKVIVEGDPDYELAHDTVELGGDTIEDISFAAYLKGWPGGDPLEPTRRQ